MSTDKRLGKKLPQRVRREDTPGVRIDSGPFIGIIKNNVDPIRAGRLSVWIPDMGGQEDDPKNWRTVSYASPFYGSTLQPTSSNNTFDEVQHSYGMWAVVPDIGNQVICTFIGGDANRGFWFACINPNLGHYMVPGLAAGNVVDNESTKDAKLKGLYDPATSNWPVAEFNETTDAAASPTWVNNGKPVHPFQANVLLNQGLDRDRVRGAVTSSSQRESPSNVFGISTPGRPTNDPMDDPTFADKLKAGTLTDVDYAIKGRKGGHTFVMDDGDQTGGSQLIRLRTAGGHQIMMNDTDRSMYIANSDGSVWMEFTGGGHINLYSSAGLNIRTEGDLNLHSDKDINMHSGGTIKMKAESAIATETATHTIRATSGLSIGAGKIGILSDGALTMQSASGGWNSDGKLVLKGSKIMLNTESPPAVAEVPNLKTYEQSDTGWTDGKWVNEESVFESIAMIAPSHEPWPRGAGKGAPAKKVVSQFAPAPQPVKQTSVCAPPGGVAPSSTVVDVGSGAGPFGDYIASLESGRPAYNAFNRGSSPPPGTGSPRESLDLTNMPISEILAAMNLPQTPENKTKRLFAVGRYQCIPTTLTAACTKLGINTSSPFSKEVQDNIFVNYLCKSKQPKINAYLSNPNKDDQTLLTAAISGTAGEWASIVDPNLGRGRYDGVGTNTAHGAVAQSELALKSQWDFLKANGNTNVVTTGTGAVVTSGSGAPITTGAGALDPGQEAAKGKPVENPAPQESMSKADAPNPVAIASTQDKIPGLIATQVKALMVQIGYAESYSDYTSQDNNLGRIGRYKFNNILLRDYGYIKPDYVKMYKAQAVFRDDAYTGKDGVNSVSDFTSGKGVQNSLMEKIINDYYAALVKNQGIAIQDDVCVVAGMISVAYYFRDSERGFISGNPPDQAKFWRQQRLNSGNGNALGIAPYNQGRYAIDVLSIASSGAPAISASAPLTSGINPDDVLTFTNRSGDRQHFDAATADFRDRLLSAAKEYKEQTGKKLTISSTVRTQTEQDAIYNGWIAAGGQLPGNPTVNVSPYGNISRPVKIVGNHGLGIAADVGTADAAEMNSMGILAKYGLYLFDPVGDPPHVQLKSELRPTNLAVIQTLPGTGAG